MNDWKHYFYKIVPQAHRMRSSIDVSERVELRKKLNCKSFKWYLQNVFQDHFLPTPMDRFGRMSNSNYCTAFRPGDTGPKNHRLLGAPCTMGFDLWQLWLYTADRRIRTDEHLCLSVVQLLHTTSDWKIQLKECAGFDTEYWDFKPKIGRLQNRKTGLCLVSPDIFDPTKDEFNPPIVQKCRSSDERQNWTITEMSWLPEHP